MRDRDINLGGEGVLQQEATRLLGAFNFTPPQKREMWEAFKAAPDGVERCALRAKVVGQREGRTAAGLLLTMVRDGEHLLEPDPTAQRITGYRWVRGQAGASGTFVEDPEGTDKPPDWYDFTTRNPVVAQPPQEDLPVPLTDEIRAELSRFGVRPESEAVEGYPA